MFVHVISKPLDLDKMRMGWIRNNSVDKKILTEKIFSKQFSVALIISIHCNENTKQLNNETKQEKYVRFAIPVTIN